MFSTSAFLPPMLSRAGLLSTGNFKVTGLYPHLDPLSTDFYIMSTTFPVRAGKPTAIQTTDLWYVDDLGNPTEPREKTGYSNDVLQGYPHNYCWPSSMYLHPHFWRGGSITGRGMVIPRKFSRSPHLQYPNPVPITSSDIQESHESAYSWRRKLEIKVIWP